MSILNAIKHISKRRKFLSQSINTKKHFSKWEETCVPSYCHSNLAAAYISWWRLFKSVNLAKKNIQNTPEKPNVLDFGASVGELGQLLPEVNYHFIEEEEIASKQLLSSLPKATTQSLINLPKNFYDVIFALDSLEHNSNYEELLEHLAESLNEVGVLIISGPTESILYKIGRKIAGFDGHYHETNIYTIEKSTRKILQFDHVSSLPWFLPLFRISVWKKLTDNNPTS